MPYTLVVVDMQPEFEAARDGFTINQVCAEIRQAKLDGARIVVLEYEDHGPTDVSIELELDEYDNCRYMSKGQDDGSCEVEWGITQWGDGKLPGSLCKVCGVNWGACVRATVQGLSDLGYEVEVLKNACNQPDDWSTDDWFDYEDYNHDFMANLPNTIVTNCVA